MSTDKSVIHKAVYRLDAPGDSGLVQSFEVPQGAELVSIDWDTRNPLGIALWYRFRVAREAAPGTRLPHPLGEVMKSVSQTHGSGRCDACEAPGIYRLCCADHQARMCPSCADANHGGDR